MGTLEEPGIMEGLHDERNWGNISYIGRGSSTSVLKFRYISYVPFITPLCILLLSLCFGSACTPLTLLQLRYILWCFIDCFGIIFGDLTCAFLSGVKDFMHLLCTIIGHDISNIHITHS